MVNPLRGEIEAVLGGTTYKLRLNIGDLMELDIATGLGTLNLLKSFGTDPQISRVVAVLSQAIKPDGKRMSLVRVQGIIENAGFRDSVTACVNILSAVLLDQSEGNAGAAEAGETPQAA